MSGCKILCLVDYLFYNSNNCLMLFCYSFLIYLSACSELPFDIRDHKDWLVSLSHLSNPFFQIEIRTDSFVMLSNNSILSQIYSTPPIGNTIFHFNITSNVIDVFDVSMQPKATVKMLPIDEENIALRGYSNDNEYDIYGYISSNKKKTSQIFIASLDRSDVYVMNNIMQKNITLFEILERLTPGLCVLFFMGFGKLYQKHFWNQFSQMNTRTLQNRINEAM